MFSTLQPAMQRYCCKVDAKKHIYKRSLMQPSGGGELFFISFLSEKQTFLKISKFFSIFFFMLIAHNLIFQYTKKDLLS